MEIPLFILVGAKPPKSKVGNPGGMLTMSIGLCDYVLSQGYCLEVIDTLQTSFPALTFKVRLKKGVVRIFQLLKLLTTRKVKGVIIFSANGPSFYERILMAGLCRLYCVKSVFFMLSGPFVVEMERNRFARSLARVLLKFPSVVGIQGNSWQPFYRKLGVNAKKIVTIRNWLPCDFLVASKPLAEQKPDEIIRFCFVGWLIEEKGVRELFEAIKILAKNYDFEFVFVGGGTLQQELNEKIKQSNLVKRVKVTGWVDCLGVRDYLSTSHVFMLPSKAEGFPMALLEAMSLGLPAICTNVGAVADSLINDKNGYLLKDGRTDSIAEAMKCYLRSPELIARHSAEALKIFSQEHDADKNPRLLFDQFLL